MDTPCVIVRSPSDLQKLNILDIGELHPYWIELISNVYLGVLERYGDGLECVRRISVIDNISVVDHAKTRSPRVAIEHSVVISSADGSRRPHVLFSKALLGRDADLDRTRRIIRSRSRSGVTVLTERPEEAFVLHTFLHVVAELGLRDPVVRRDLEWAVSATIRDTWRISKKNELRFKEKIARLVSDLAATATAEFVTECLVSWHQRGPLAPELHQAVGYIYESHLRRGLQHAEYVKAMARRRYEAGIRLEPSTAWWHYEQHPCFTSPREMQQLESTKQRCRVLWQPLALPSEVAEKGIQLWPVSQRSRHQATKKSHLKIEAQEDLREACEQLAFSRHLFLGAYGTSSIPETLETSATQVMGNGTRAGGAPRTRKIQNTPKADRRSWFGLAVLSLPTILLSLDLSLLHLALPSIAEDLRPNSTELLWILDIYGFMIAGFLITMGNLGDRIGRRRLLLVGAATFGVLSVVAAYANSAHMLIVLRGLLGIAGATLMPSTLALITNMFRDPRQRTAAISIWMASFLGGIAVGPVIGGYLLDYFWWGSVFLIGVPVMIVLLVAGPLLLPEYRDTHSRSLDVVGVALSLLAILPAMYGIKEIARNGPEWLNVALIVTGAVAGMLFVRRQARHASPMVDLALFRRPQFVTALMLMLLSAATAAGIYLFLAQYLQLVKGLSPLRSGLWFLPAAVATVIVAVLTPSIAARIGAVTTVTVALVLSAAGAAVLTQVDAADELTVAVVGMVIVFLGVGPISVLGTDLVVTSAPPSRAGAASSLSETSSELGVALGVAILGSLGSAAYHARIPESWTGVPDGAATVVGDTLPGAMAVVSGLPSELGQSVWASACDAFVHGMHVAAGASGIVLLLLAVASITWLRDGDSASSELPIKAAE